MEEILEIGGQGLLAALAAVALIGITTFLLSNTNGNDGIITLGEYMFQTLDSLLP